MSAAGNGGPAFPFAWPGGDGEPVVNEGLSLRDYFAAQAMVSIAGNSLGEGFWSEADIAADCYALADAMLAQRVKP